MVMDNDSLIKNIIFDIGNVLVKWSPHDVIKYSFGNDVGIEDHINNIFKNDIWTMLNLGKLTEKQAIDLYCEKLPYSNAQMVKIFENIKNTQTLIDGSIAMLIALYKKKYKLFALSDNIVKVVAYLKEKYNFWDYFLGVVISADIGLMKPNKNIFDYLLRKYNLNANETLFIDDHMPNIQSARNLNLKAINFIDINQCLNELSMYGIQI